MLNFSVRYSPNTKSIGIEGVICLRKISFLKKLFQVGLKKDIVFFRKNSLRRCEKFTRYLWDDTCRLYLKKSIQKSTFFQCWIFASDIPQIRMRLKVINAILFVRGGSRGPQRALAQLQQYTANCRKLSILANDKLP